MSRSMTKSAARTGPGVVRGGRLCRARSRRGVKGGGPKAAPPGTRMGMREGPALPRPEECTIRAHPLFAVPSSSVPEKPQMHADRNADGRG